MDFDPDSSIDSTEKIKVALVRERRLSRFGVFEDLMNTFSPGERLLLYVLAILLALSAFGLLVAANTSVSVDVPASGGTLTEGEVGPARFVNPILTMSQADEDLTQLIYSGLTRTLPDGSVVPDLANSYEISPDGTKYSFKIRPNATFQDGTPVTSADVLFTVESARNPDIKSSHRADWEGVSVETPDAHTVIFKLPRAYAPFIQNTSMGILPKHLWDNTSAEEFPFSPVNTHPVGSGPYRVSGVETDSTGSVTRYDLVPFNNFTLGRAFLNHITLLFYPNEDAMLKAFNQGRIDAIAGISPQELADLKRTDTTTLTAPLPRVFSVFFNQARATVLSDSSVRAALDAALDKQRLVNSVLDGYGLPIDGPIPPGIIDDAPRGSHISATSTNAYTDETLAQARALLSKGGWAYDSSDDTWSKKPAKGGKQTLDFTLATADSPQLLATANAVAAAWQALGVKVTVQVYSLSELNSTILRPREYDAVLFGEVVGRELDLFAFWHSSQRNDPGLNLSLYASSQADTLLSKARATTNALDRNRYYTQFASLIVKDKPAVFLYTPEFLYQVPTRLKGIHVGEVTMPAERFQNVYQWYTDTERIWSIFAKNEGAL